MRFQLIIASFLLIIYSCKEKKITSNNESKAKSHYLENLKAPDLDNLSISIIARINCTESQYNKLISINSVSQDSVQICEINFSDSLKCITESKESCLSLLKNFEKEVNLSKNEQCIQSSDTIVFVSIKYQKKEKAHFSYCKKSMINRFSLSEILFKKEE